MNPAAGRKVFFLSSSPLLQATVAALQVQEYEVYLIENYRNVKNLMRQFPGSIFIMDIDRQMQPGTWRAFVTSISHDKELAEALVGLFSARYEQELMAKFFAGARLEAGIMAAEPNTGPQELAADFAQQLDAFNAKGRRQHVRTICAADKNARLYWIDQHMFIHQMKVLDISTAAAAVLLPASLAGRIQAPQPLPSATLLLGKDQHVIYPTVLTTKEAGGKTIAVLMFTGGLEHESEQSIRAYVCESLKRQTMAAINGMPEDRENYRALEEQDKLVQSMQDMQETRKTEPPPGNT